jgi:WD40 repeat protein
MYEDWPFHVWDLSSGRIAWKSPTPLGGEVYFRNMSAVLAFSAHENELATFSNTEQSPQQIVIWNYSNGNELKPWNTGIGIECLAYSPNGTRLVAACEDRRLRIWCVYTGELVREIDPGIDPWQPWIKFSPDGKCVVLSKSLSELVKWEMTGDGDLASPLHLTVNGWEPFAATTEGRRL